MKTSILKQRTVVALVAAVACAPVAGIDPK